MGGEEAREGAWFQEDDPELPGEEERDASFMEEEEEENPQGALYYRDEDEGDAFLEDEDWDVNVSLREDLLNAVENGKRIKIFDLLAFSSLQREASQPKKKQK